MNDMIAITNAGTFDRKLFRLFNIFDLWLPSFIICWCSCCYIGLLLLRHWMHVNTNTRKMNYVYYWAELDVGCVKGKNRVINWATVCIWATKQFQHFHQFWHRTKLQTTAWYFPCIFHSDYWLFYSTIAAVIVLVVVFVVIVLFALLLLLLLLLSESSTSSRCSRIKLSSTSGVSYGNSKASNLVSWLRYIIRDNKVSSNDWKNFLFPEHITDCIIDNAPDVIRCCFLCYIFSFFFLLFCFHILFQRTFHPFHILPLLVSLWFCHKRMTLKDILTRATKMSSVEFIKYFVPSSLTTTTTIVNT